MLRFFILSLALFIFNTRTYADTKTLNLDDKTNAIMHRVMQKYGIPGAAVIIYKDGEMHQYFYGVTRTKSNEQVTGKTIFEIGSITKTFTALMLAQEINQGTLNLNDKIAPYLDDNVKPSKSIGEITFLELATHTSSLPYNIPNLSYNASSNSHNEKILNQFLHSWTAPYPIGKQELYSNFGFSLLGITLSNHADEDLFDLLQDKILAPLGMNSTYMSIPKNVSQFYSYGYTATGTLSRTPAAGILGGGWAIKSSSNDMEKYLAASLGLSSVPENIVNAIKTAQTPYFEFSGSNKQMGLSWGVTPLDKVTTAELLKVTPLAPRKTTPNMVTPIASPKYNGNALIEKTGSTNGFRAYIGVIPKQKIGVVILTNKFIFDSGVIEHTGREILFNN
jgi:beta-lactamase class C